MAFHHVTLATKDLQATHQFYTELMGFDLVKVDTAPTPDGTGWSRLVFYDTGGNGMMSFFELHSDSVGADFKTDLSQSVGLPLWVNHLAFDAPTLDDLEARKQCWREHGINVVGLDFGHTRSIYAIDPNGSWSSSPARFVSSPLQKNARGLSAISSPSGLSSRRDPSRCSSRPSRPPRRDGCCCYPAVAPGTTVFGQAASCTGSMTAAGSVGGVMKCG